MKCELYFDNNYLDLPSLTKIQGNGYIHEKYGTCDIGKYVLLYLI